MPAPIDRQSVIVVEASGSRPSPDIADAVAHAVRVCFGVLSIAQSVAERSSVDPTGAARKRRLLVPAADVADLLVATAWGAARVSGRLAVAGSRAVVPLAELVARPPLVPRVLQPGEAARRLIERWKLDRSETVRALDRWSTTALPGAVEAVLSQVDMERLVRVVLDQLDLDALVADVLERLDIDTVTAAVLSRADLTSIASSAITQTDLDRVLEEALGRVDVTRIVREQIDLIGIAEYVVDGIDLPEIIRDSTGSVASEAVRVMRLQGVEGDVALARVVDRLLHRRRDRRLDATVERPQDSSDVHEESPSGPTL